MKKNINRLNILRQYLKLLKMEKPTGSQLKRIQAIIYMLQELSGEKIYNDFQINSEKRIESAQLAIDLKLIKNESFKY
jgi:hypothetical protein